MTAPARPSGWRIAQIHNLHRESVAGHYSLAAGSVRREIATSRVRRNMPDPVPIVLLERLAIGRAWQSSGVGADLLRDSVLRAISAGETIGIRAILLHVISEHAKALYNNYRLRPSPVEPLSLMVMLYEARPMFAANH